MQCVLYNGEVFAKIVDAIKDLCGEGNIDFSIDGMQMQIMDPAHVSLCALVLQEKYFKSFSCAEPISLGLNFKTLSMVLRGAKGELKLASKDDKLEITVQKLSGIAQYSINLMDIDSEQLGLPDATYPAICALSSSVFAKVVRDLMDFSDTCTMSIGEKLSISVKGDVGNVKWEGESKCNVTDAVPPLQFALRYMCLFSKGAAITPQVIIGMSPEMPVCLTYPIEDAGHMRFYLAPKTME